MRIKKSILRINQHIRAPQVRLIAEDGQMVGIKSIQEALRLADDRGYDLIEIVPTGTPPVCKLGNFSKYLYELEKKNKDQKKNRGAGQVKEVRIRPSIGEHDFQTKINAMIRFLKERHKVRICMVFHGREMEHKERGEDMMGRIEQAIEAVGMIEQKPQQYGNRFISIIVPK